MRQRSHEADGGIAAYPPNQMQEEANYVCDACGEEIVIPIDVSQGARQQYVEDCPVCCRPHLIHVVIDGQGSAHAWAEPE